MTDVNDDSLNRRVGSILQLLVVAELALVAATWRMWFCATDFPRVPLIDVFLPASVVAVRAVSAGFVVALVVALLLGFRQQRGSGKGTAGLMVLLGGLAVCCNQHCLQPWHWLFLLTFAFRLVLSLPALLWVLQRLVPCIYIFAAVSRLGPLIDTGMTRRIVTTLLELVALPDLPGTVSRLCVAATIVELAAGVLLLFSRSRYLGMYVACSMHVTLLVALGPFGLGQHTGVLIWNGFLALWVLLLFSGERPAANAVSLPALAAAVFCFVWPLLALAGVTDNWTGWQLYSPRPEVLQLEVHIDLVNELPEAVAEHVQDPRPLEDWCVVRLDRWSLQSAGVPIYPQGRFLIAIADSVTTELSNPSDVRATLWRPVSPQWWQRESVEYANQSALQSFNDGRWLNGRTARNGRAE